jgi:16S rRNA (cytosine1402-N4)-methyltransferase
VAKTPHTSVLLAESIAAMALRDGDIAVDCTVGAGGHTEAMLAAVGQKGRIIGIDRDQSALDLAGARLADDVQRGRLTLVKSAYSDVAQVLTGLGLKGQVRGILADIGVSSMHLDQAARGFSFMSDGPLDMRMDQTQGRTAADLIAEESKEDLAKLFFEYGEEPMSRRIADFILRARAEKPITTTAELAALVTKAIPYAGKSKKHPATKVFQALRIAVNDELGELERLIADGFGMLADDGRLAIITFHSLEDRIVKERFQDKAGKAARAAVPRDLPLTAEQLRAAVKSDAVVVKPFPIVPSDDEIAHNPRSRSAKLRVLEKKSKPN